MSRWTTRTLVSAEPADVRDLLTDPLAATRWSPLPFRVESMGGPRLTEATPACVSTKLAGRRARFEVQLTRSTERSLTVRCDGPFAIDARYRLREVVGGTELEVGIDLLEPRGLPGRALIRAATLLLETGLLRLGVARFAAAAERQLALA